MAYNTGNPIGSGDPRDLRDNAENLDAATNSQSAEWTDRLGNKRPTIAGAIDPTGLAQAAASSAQESEQQADRAETARDAAFVNADVYDDVTAGLADTVDGEQFQAVEGDEVVRYRNDAGSATELARYPASDFVYGIFSAPFNLDKFGPWKTPNPRGMVTSEITIDNAKDEVTIAPGVGNNYFCQGANGGATFTPGSRLVVWFRVISGEMGSATFAYAGSTYTFKKSGDFYVVDVEVSYETFSNFSIENASDTLPLVVTNVAYAESLPGAEFSDLPNNNGVGLRNFFLTGGTEAGEGNQWPEVTYSGDGQQSLVPFAKAPGSKQVAIAYITNEDGTAPAIVDNLWLRYQGGGEIHNAFFQRVVGHPGYYICEAAHTMTVTSEFISLYIDNSQTGPFYNEVPIVVQFLHFYDNALPLFLGASGGASGGYATDELIVNHSATGAEVYVPAGITSNNKYIRYSHQDFNTAPGGGSGSQLDSYSEMTRTGEESFLYERLIDVTGSQLVGALYEDSTGRFSFGSVHGYCEPSAPSRIFVEGNEVDISTTETYKCAEFLRIDYSKVFVPETTTHMADLTIAYHYIAAEKAVYVDVTAVARGTFDVGPWFLSQWTFDPNVLSSAIQPGFGYRNYVTPGGDIFGAENEGQSEVIMTGPVGISAQIEAVKGDVLSSGIQFASSKNKSYFSATLAGGTYSFHQSPTPPATTVNDGDTFRMVTKLVILSAN